MPKDPKKIHKKRLKRKAAAKRHLLAFRAPSIEARQASNHFRRVMRKVKKDRRAY